MNCSPKTMLKIAIGLAAVLAFAYFALPEAQAASEGSSGQSVRQQSASASHNERRTVRHR